LSTGGHLAGIVHSTSNATFSVTTIGYSPMSYQWSFNATNILGATNVSLTLTNVNPNQTGGYSVTVTNAYGNLTSSNAVLSVFQTSAQLTFAPAVTNGVGYSVKALTVADVNGDGKMDIIAASGGTFSLNNGTLSVLTNNGSGGFTLASSPTPSNSAPDSVAAADVNGDGKVDLICANGTGSTLTVASWILLVRILLTARFRYSSTPQFFQRQLPRRR
jgi:hypothetical protein